jgi:AcrR family transcriptional regulator
LTRIFRYFPSKEDVVIWDEYDPLALELLEARSEDEPLAEALRRCVTRHWAGSIDGTPSGLLTRVRLSLTVPELRARFLDEQTHGLELLAPVLARKRGTSADELHLRVVGSALFAAVFVALDLWQKDGGKRDLLALLDDATEALAEGLHELQLRPRAQTCRGLPLARDLPG